MRTLLTCLLVVAAALFAAHSSPATGVGRADEGQRNKKKPTPTPTLTPTPTPDRKTLSNPANRPKSDDEVNTDRSGGAPASDDIDTDKSGGVSSGGGDITSGGVNTRTVASGQKLRLKGIVTRRDADTFVLMDQNGVLTTVALTNSTSVKTKGGFLRGGANYGVTAILRGLNLEVEGRGDGANLVANKVRFSDTDLRTARVAEANVKGIENRVNAAENRIGQVEANSQRLSGQLDELAAISNAARGGAKAAQETADAAVGGVNATNERISALDDYQVNNSTSVLFRVGSSVLSPQAKQQLDQIARQALQAKGYVLEIGGFASADGSVDANRRLSQRRADTVIRYLVENHQIPLRRVITPYGFGESSPVADNTTRSGREENRRVEVKILVNRGIIQGAPAMNTPKPENP
jgi:outer membrane protein OmpA-like peptidoglycan-associated protein